MRLQCSSAFPIYGSAKLMGRVVLAHGRTTGLGLGPIPHTTRLYEAAMSND
jgi:hypothetical protein